MIYDWSPFFGALQGVIGQLGQQKQYNDLVTTLSGGTPQPGFMSRLLLNPAIHPSQSPQPMTQDQMVDNQMPSGAPGALMPMQPNAPQIGMPGGFDASIFRKLPPQIGMPLLLQTMARQMGPHKTEMVAPSATVWDTVTQKPIYTAPAQPEYEFKAGINPATKQADMLVIDKKTAQAKWLGVAPSEIQFVNGQAVDKTTGKPLEGVAPIPNQPEAPKSPERQRQDIEAALARRQLSEGQILNPILQKVLSGAPLTEGEQNVLGTLKPNATPVQTDENGNAIGTTGFAEIDPTGEGYATKPVKNAGGLTQSAIDQSARTLALTDRFPIGMGIGSSGAGGQRKNAIQNRAAELNAGGNIAANKAQLQALQSSLTEQTKYANTTERAVSNAEKGYAQLVDAFKGKVNNSNLPIINAITNAAAYQLSPGDISAFKAGLTEVANEYANVFSRGGTMTDAVRAQAKSIADGNLSINDLNKVLNELRAQGEIVIGGAKAQAAKIHGAMNSIIQNGQAPNGLPQVGPAQQVQGGRIPFANAKGAAPSIDDLVKMYGGR